MPEDPHGSGVSRRVSSRPSEHQTAPSSIRTSICGNGMAMLRVRKVRRIAWLISLTAAP